MYLLKKVFQFRESTSQEDSEKPFLEHLEDLRITLTRMTIALLIATIGCFVFRNELMDIIRKPVTEVWQTSQKEALKDLEVKIDIDSWEKAKLAARDSAPLSPEQRDLYFEKNSTDGVDLRFHAESVLYLRAALSIKDEEKRGEFAAELPGIDEPMRKQVEGLLRGKPEVAVDARGKMVYMQTLNPTEGFMLSIKLAFFAGIVLAFPFLLYFLLQFVLPGLHESERKALFPAMAIGFGLFLLGVGFAYWFVLPRVLEFFYSWSLEMGIENEWRIGYYISFATQFTLIFGLAFELPVVVMTLVKLGIMSYDMMKKTRSYAILAIFVIAAIITPTPDAFTLCLLAVPMIILYEICIWLAYFIQKKEREREEEEERERRERFLAAGPTAAIGTEESDESDGAEESDQPDGADEHEDDDYHYEDDYGSEDEYGTDYDHDEEAGDEETGEEEEAEDQGFSDGEETPGEAAWRETLGSEVPEEEVVADEEVVAEEEVAADESAPAEQSGDSQPDSQPEFDLDEPDPESTEEGEEEDVSDPWDEEEEDDEGAKS